MEEKTIILDHTNNLLNNTGERKSDLLGFLKIVGKLKKVKRAGWVKFGIPNPESISDHMYRMAMMAFLITSQDKVDKDKCIKMALVHDLAESLVGDITPFDNVTKEEKYHREETAMTEICQLVDGEIGNDIHSLWKEYEDQKTPESQLVKDFDIIEMLIQAQEYESSENMPGHLQQFFDNTTGKIKSDLVREWETKLRSNRLTNEKLNVTTES